MTQNSFREVRERFERAQAAGDLELASRILQQAGIDLTRRPLNGMPESRRVEDSGPRCDRDEYDMYHTYPA